MTSFVFWICQVCRDFRKLVATFFSICPCNCWSRPNVLCSDWFLAVALISGHDMNSLFLGVDVATTISCRDLTVLPFTEIYVATSISCRDINSVASYVDLCCDNVFLAP